MRNQDTKSYALGTELAEWAASLVFLTSTPINLHQQDLLNLLELLAPEDFGDLQDLKLRLEPNKIINAVAAGLTEARASGHALNAQLGRLGTTTLGRALTRRPEFALLTELLARDELAPRDIVQAKRYLADLNTLSTVITRTRKVEVDDRRPSGPRIARRCAGPRQKRTSTPSTSDGETIGELGGYASVLRDADAIAAHECLPADGSPRRARPSILGEISDADSDASTERLEPHAGLIEAALRLPESVDTKFDLLNRVMHALHGQGRRHCCSPTPVRLSPTWRGAWNTTSVSRSCTAG